MSDVFARIAPLGFEQFPPLVSPLDASSMPMVAKNPAARDIEPMQPERGISLDGKWHHHQLGSKRTEAASREFAGEDHDVLYAEPNGMALLSASVGRVLLEAQEDKGH